MKQQKPNSTLPIFLIASGALLLLAVVVLLAARNPAAAPPPDASHEEETYPEIPRVSPEEAKAAFDSGSAIFVDVRPQEAYEQRHIAGSINLPLAELEARMGELDEPQWIITYCT